MIIQTFLLTPAFAGVSFFNYIPSYAKFAVMMIARFKRWLLIVLALAVCTSSCKKKTADIVAEDTRHYNEINGKLSSYKTIRVDDITNAGGGYITGYYRDDEVKKVVAEHYFDTGRSFTEYYFDDGFLAMVVDQSFRYNKPVSYTEEKARANNDSVWYSDKKTRMEVSTCYLKDNNLIKWIDFDGKEIKPGSPAFINEQSTLWAEAKVLLMQLKEQ